MYEQKDEPGSSHSLLKHYLSQTTKNARVLEVGTATGFLGNSIQNYQLKLFGIEPNESWASIAKPHYEDVFVGKLEEAKDDFLTNYDVVICTDVLEHMVDPNTQLIRLVKLQAQHTRFLICVPNIANIWVRVNLLFGKFEYANRGILDRTHLHFFTLNSLKELLMSSGLTIEKCEPTPIPLAIINPFFCKTNLGKLMQSILRKCTSLLPTLLGYQFFCLAFVAPIEKE